MPDQPPVECPECGATTVEPCHKEPPKVDCVRKEDQTLILKEMKAAGYIKPAAFSILGLYY